MITGLQILGVIFGLSVAYFTFLNFKKKYFEKTQFIFWEILWLVFIIITIFPNLISNFSKELGFVRTMDFLTLIGFIAITSLSFYNYVVINRVAKNLEKVVREEALKQTKI